MIYILLTLTLSVFFSSLFALVDKKTYKNYGYTEKYYKEFYYEYLTYWLVRIIPFFAIFFSAICYFNIQSEKRIAALPTWQIAGTNITFKDTQHFYRCIGGVAYMFPSYHNSKNDYGTYQNLIVDEMGKPRKCYVVKQGSNI